MARVEVHADHRADRLAQAEQRFRVVNQLHAVVFEGDFLNAAVLGHLHDVLPLGNRDFVPLIIQNVLRLGRPRGRDPDRGLIALAAGRQAAHHNDFLNAEHLRKLEGLFRDVHILLIRERIARAVECAQLQALRTHGVEPLFARGLIAYEQIEVAVRCARPVARADFDGGDFLLHAEIQHFLIRHIKCTGLNGQLHSIFLLSIYGVRDERRGACVFSFLPEKGADSPLVLSWQFYHTVT